MLLRGARRHACKARSQSPSCSARVHGRWQALLAGAGEGTLPDGRCSCAIAATRAQKRDMLKPVQAAASHAA